MDKERTISTQWLAEKDQFPYWREVICDSVIHISAEREQRGPFHGELRRRDLGELKVASLRSDPHVRHRTRTNLARYPDDAISVYLALTGTLQVECADGQRVDAGPGRPIFLDHQRETRLRIGPGLHQVGIRIPRQALQPLVSHGNVPLAPPPSTLLSLLGAYTVAIANMPTREAPLAGLADNYHGLLALVLGANSDGRERGSAGSRQVRVQQVHAWINANYADPAATPREAAAHLGISERYLHKVLEPTGLTFSEILMRRRLRAAYNMLLDPTHDSETIARIAYAAGFGDLSHFNRSFKAHHEATPREIRRGRPEARSWDGD